MLETITLGLQTHRMDLVKAGEEWFIKPDPGAINDTMLNGRKITKTTKLYDGDIIGVGKESKGIVKTPMIVRLPYGVVQNAQNNQVPFAAPTPASVPLPKKSTSETSQKETIDTTNSARRSK